MKNVIWQMENDPYSLSDPTLPTWRKHLTRNVDCFLSLVSYAARDDVKCLVRLLVGQFENHGQIDAGHNLDRRAAQKSAGEIGRRAAEHVRQQQHTRALVDALNRLADLIASDLYVIVPPNGDGGDVMNVFVDDRFRSADQFGR